MQEINLVYCFYQLSNFRRQCQTHQRYLFKINFMGWIMNLSIDGEHSIVVDILIAIVNNFWR